MSDYYSNLRYLVAQRLAAGPMMSKLAEDSEFGDSTAVPAALLASPFALKGFMEGYRSSGRYADKLLKAVDNIHLGTPPDISKLRYFHHVRPGDTSWAGMYNTTRGLNRAVHDLWLASNVRQILPFNSLAARAIITPAVGWRRILWKIGRRAGLPMLGAYAGIKGYRWMFDGS